MATYNSFDQFIADVHNGVHNLNTATFGVAITTVVPVVGNSVLTDLTTVSLANAISTTFASLGSSQTGGNYTLQFPVSKVIEASGGNIGPFRYVVIYNDSAVSDNLIAWFDYGSEITLNDGETITLDFDDTSFFTATSA